MRSKVVSFSVFILTTLFSLAVLNVFSQKKQFNGFYMGLSGDTVRGSFPNYKQWNQNPDKVRFQAAGKGVETVLTAFNCAAFQVEDYDSYVAYKGLRMVNPVTYSNATPEDNDEFDSVATFLRKIAATPEYTFYVYTDRRRINLFYAGADKLIKELIQKASIVNNNFIQSKTYQGQLKDLFGDENARSVLYTEESLASFVNKKAGASVPHKKVKNPNSGFVIMAGISLNTLKFTPYTGLDFTQKKYPGNVLPLASIGYIVSLPRSLERFYLFPQLRLYSFKHTGTTDFNNGQITYNSTFSSSPVIALAFNAGCNVVNTTNLKLSAVIGGGFAALSKNEQIEERFFPSLPNQNLRQTTEMSHRAAFFNVQTHVIIMKKFLGWAAYSLPMSITNYDAKFSRLSSIQVGVGYKF